MPDLAWTQLVVSAITTLILATLCGCFLAGWIVTRRQYDDLKAQHREEKAQLLAELGRTQADRAAEYTRMDREYARMVDAKEYTISVVQAQVAEWRSIAREAIADLEVTSREATKAVEHVAARLPEGEK